MKKIILLIIFAVLFSVTAFADFDDISAQRAILYCCDTGDVLFEKNADEKSLIASITKIMTAIVVIENEDLDKTVSIKPEWCGLEGSSMYLEAGEKISIRQLLTGMMLASGNDAAHALACITAGSDENFAKLMNDKAADLGMDATHFDNPHGLDSENHYSTARDMAILAAYCMQNEDFKHIVSTKSAVIGEQTFVNHNKLLWNVDGCIGVKTGYTSNAGRTLVSCVEKDGMTLICVTLNAPDDWNDHMSLYESAFAQYKLAGFEKNEPVMKVPLISATKSGVYLAPENSAYVLCKSEDDIKIVTETQRMFFGGVMKGTYAGKIKLYINDTLAAEENLVYTENTMVDKAQAANAAERFIKLFSLSIKPYYITEEK